MPLLPQPRDTYQASIDEVEKRLDGWIREVDDLLATAAVVHSAYMRAQTERITRLRSGFAAMREASHAHSA